MTEIERAAALRKPVPIMDGDSRPFWEGCAQRKLLIQRCAECGQYNFYPRIICPHCHRQALQWVEAAGQGRIYSYTIARRPAGPVFAGDVPYIIALVELAEGVRIMSNIVGIPVEDVRCDLPVEVMFEVVEGVTLPKFTPRKSKVSIVATWREKHA